MISHTLMVGGNGCPSESWLQKRKPVLGIIIRDHFCSFCSLWSEGSPKGLFFLSTHLQDLGHTTWRERGFCTRLLMTLWRLFMPGGRRTEPWQRWQIQCCQHLLFKSGRANRLSGMAFGIRAREWGNVKAWPHFHRSAKKSEWMCFSLQTFSVSGKDRGKS